MAGATASITIAQREIDKALMPLFASWQEEHRTDVNRDLGLIKNSVIDQKLEVTEELIAIKQQVSSLKVAVDEELSRLRQSVADKQGTIDRQFEDLKLKIEKRAAYILIPVTVVVLLVGAAGVITTVWAPFASAAKAVDTLKDKTGAMTTEVTSLNDKVKEATNTLKTIKDNTQLQSELSSLQGFAINLQQDIKLLKDAESARKNTSPKGNQALPAPKQSIKPASSP